MNAFCLENGIIILHSCICLFQTPSEADPSGVPTSAVSLSNIPLPPVVSEQDVTTLEDKSKIQKTPPLSPATRLEDTTLIASPQDANSLTNQPVIDQSDSLSSTKSGKLLLEEMFQAAQSAGASLGEAGLGDSVETASSTRSFPIGNTVKSRKSNNIYI